MGHKKRNPAPRSKQSSAADSPVAPPVIGGAANDTTSPLELDSFTISDHSLDKIESAPQSGASINSAIKLECERVLTAFPRGNHTRALKLMKDCCSKHESSPQSAFIHRVQGTLCVKVAAIIDDLASKQRHLRNAVESGRKAVELSPNLIEFTHFYANLMFNTATEATEFEEVVQECERALAIENPTDPAKESLQQESQQKIATAEARVEHVQNELRQLIQKANIASLSSWMKNLSNGEEKFRFIPIRRPAEDPMELRLVQGRRPNEIKKVNKTPEERRKEIEVRVAAARLLQQKSESPQSQSEVDRDERTLDSSLGSGHRRKYGHMRKNGDTAERKGWVQSYWNAMSMDMKKDLLRIRVCDIKSHFGSLKDTFPNDVLSEALSHAEVNKTWKFWLCCRCDEKYSNLESHGQHVVQEHMGNRLPKMQRLLPQNVDSEWIEMILNCSWKPLDVSAAVKMLENKAKFKDSSFPADSCLGHHTEEVFDCFKDASSSYHDNGSLRYSLYNCTIDSSNCCKLQKVILEVVLKSKDL